MFSHLRHFLLHAPSRAVGLIFTSSGFLFGNWVPQIPAIKERFLFDDGQLGLILLAMPFGATISNPIATLLLQRLGMRKLTIWAVLVLPMCFALPVFAPNVLMLGLALFCTGCGLSILNIAVNTAATAVEHQHKTNILSSCHGMWSLGGAFGSFVCSTLIGNGLSPKIEMLLAVLFVIVLVLSVQKIIFGLHEEAPETETQSKFVMPNRILWGMIVLSVCVNITEGTMADWTAVYMRDVVRADAQVLGWGFAFYAIFMASGRFLGDGLIPKVGASSLLKYGGLLSATGLTIAIVFPTTWIAIIGFTLVGAGVSCGAPILYGSAARMPNMAKGAGLATMNTFSITGFLVGPALIGFISKASSLPMAFSIVAFLGLFWAFLVGRTRIY